MCRTAARESPESDATYKTRKNCDILEFILEETPAKVGRERRAAKHRVTLALLTPLA